MKIQIFKNSNIVGSIELNIFHGQLHCTNFRVEKKYRNQGLGTQLMYKAFDYGRENGCNFIFLETMSFQAPKFYKKLGFQIDYIQKGFENKSSIIYLR